MVNKKLSFLISLALSNIAVADPLALSDTPLFLNTKPAPNIMILYGNSNSMDSQADGQSVGSADPVSKSEITRNAVKTLISDYQGRVNMGLMGYAQSGIALNDLSTALYDVSYNPSHYNPSWTGASTSSTNKKFRMANPTDSGNFVYYNTSLPAYGSASSNRRPLFCFTTDARSKAFSNGEKIVNNNINDANSGPWLSYRCYNSKRNTVNAGPTSASADNRAATSNETVAGYSSTVSTNIRFYPTDSDLALGITNFGNQITQYYVAQAWFSNTSPGYGYVHTPIANLNSTQIGKINTKLGTSQFSVSGTEKNANYPLVNAGLTPLAGAVNTASSYFGGTLTSSNQGGNLPAPPNSCNQNFLVMLTDGLPSVLSNGNISSNTNLLLSDLTTSVTNIKTNRNVTSYIVGFALPYGAYGEQLNNIAKAGGTTQPYYADDPDTLSNALHDVLTDIINRTSASSAVALNSGYISTNDKIYQARFNSSDWSGDLISVTLDANGKLPTDFLNSATWKAGNRISAQIPNNRVIITTKASTGRGVPFRWHSNLNPSATQLDLTQLAALSINPDSGNSDTNGQNRLNYLRGVKTLENTSFRYRASVLGDIINSAPTLVEPPNNNYLSTEYLAFKETHKNRTPIIYVGANDGMLHGINATNGNEVLGFVPNSVFSNLNKLTSKNYSHRYYVDGNPITADVTYADNSWKTVLVSGMGNGAKGIFALDVTDPTNFTEANASSLVNFEYTPANDSDIGFIQAAPSIVKLNNGKWAAIFGNGLNNSGSGQSALFIVDVETGELIKKIRTGRGNASTPNGLANPSVVDIDGNGTADYVYAGDLYGNMWKFNISNSNPNNWNISFSGSPLFSAGTGKPITTQPEVTTSPNGGYMVLFGTGLYLQASDLSTTGTQTFYGIWDNNATVAANQIKQQSITQQTDEFRRTTIDNVNYPTQKGWYLDLPNSGERSVTDPLLSGGNIFFSTITPSSITCSSGGISWLMALDYLNGTLTEKPIFDSNKDNKVDKDDTSYSGIKLASISSTPTLLKGLGNPSLPLQELFFNLSSGDVAGIYISGNKLTSRRTSWRSIIQR